MTKCTYDPLPLKGLPMGMFHCPDCGCMILAGMEHGPCDPEDCWLTSPEEEIKRLTAKEAELKEELAYWKALKGETD